MTELTRRPEGGIEYGPEWSAGFRRASDNEIREWLDLAIECCDAADSVALGLFRRDLQISAKPDRSFVTQADTAIEELIRDRIRGRFPAHGVAGEEFGEDGPGADVRWIVDPIDGTHNYMRGIPLFGTLLAVEREGELQVGVMSAPAMGERWMAWRGGGAWSHDRRLRVSHVASLADSQLLYGSRAENVASGRVPGFDATIAMAWRDRGFGDFWGHALVAEGAAEAMIEVDLKPWDIAAPMVVIEEAGGRMTDIEGRRSLTALSTVTSNGLLHEELLRRLRGEKATDE